MDGALDWTTALSAVAAGALLMAYPVVMLNLRGLLYFRQAAGGRAKLHHP